jgi:hypothetical protein
MRSWLHAKKLHNHCCQIVRSVCAVCARCAARTRLGPCHRLARLRLQSTGISVLQPGTNNAFWVGHGVGGVSVLLGHCLRHFLTPALTSSVFALAHGQDIREEAGSGACARRGRIRC